MVAKITRESPIFWGAPNPDPAKFDPKRSFWQATTQIQVVYQK